MSENSFQNVPELCIFPCGGEEKAEVQWSWFMLSDQLRVSVARGIDEAEDIMVQLQVVLILTQFGLSSGLEDLYATGGNFVE